VVKTGGGDERGRVIQLNEIPAGTLDHYWGDVAVVVATEASSGVNDVIKRQSGREPAGHDPSSQDSSGHDSSGHAPTGRDPSGHGSSGSNPTEKQQSAR
jgi:hypothetical protein